MIKEDNNKKSLQRHRKSQKKATGKKNHIDGKCLMVIISDKEATSSQVEKPLESPEKGCTPHGPDNNESEHVKI